MKYRVLGAAGAALMFCSLWFFFAGIQEGRSAYTVLSFVLLFLGYNMLHEREIKLFKDSIRDVVREELEKRESDAY